jgi:hypothetical protein
VKFTNRLDAFDHPADFRPAIRAFLAQRHGSNNL